MRKCRSCDCDLNIYSESGSKPGSCRACYSAYMRSYFKNPDNKKRHQARIKASRHKAKGIIILEPCSHCGTDNVEMHHPDHSKPYDVGFLCKGCHEAFHSLERRVYAKL